MEESLPLHPTSRVANNNGRKLDVDFVEEEGNEDLQPYDSNGKQQQLQHEYSSPRYRWQERKESSLLRTTSTLTLFFLSASVLLAVTSLSIAHLRIRPQLPSSRSQSDGSIPPWLSSQSRHIGEQQCLAAYPGLYEEADRAASYWQNKGGVTLDMVDEASKHGETARVLISGGEVYIKNKGWERGSRTRASLALINEAVTTSVEPVPDVEFVIHTFEAGDATAELPIFGLSRRISQQQLWLMPDFGFWSWPEPKLGSWSEAIRKAQAYDSLHPWSAKIPKLFWRGSPMVDVRKKFLEISQKFPKWGQVEEIDWNNKETVMTMDEHCDFKYLGHAEGWAYSGRFKYLLQCKSVVVAHEMEFIQHFHPLMNSTSGSPNQNIIILPGQDWATLPETMATLLENDSAAQQLAERSQQFWSYHLSKQSILCYWRYNIKRYAGAQRFTPELHYNDTSYESFILMGATEWDPHR